MRTIVHIVVAFAMLFGSFASFNTPTVYSASSPQQELTATPTETPLPTEEPLPTETVSPTQDPSPTELPTETPSETETPVAPTTEPTLTETPVPTDILPPTPTETVASTLDYSNWIEISMHPAVLPRSGKITILWTITQEFAPSAELLLTLPTGLTPKDANGLVYDPALNQLTFPASSGEVRLQAAAELEASEISILAALRIDGSIAAELNYPIRVVPAYFVSRNGGQVTALDGRVTVEIPAGALSEDAMFTVNAIETGDDFLPSGVLTEITAAGVDSDTEITHFDQPVKIGLSYAGIDFDGYESALVVQYYNEETQSWQYMPSYVDMENDIVYTHSDHLTVFSLDINNWQAARLPSMDAASVSGYTGGASYSVPIWTPPGPGGLQPSVALNYSSQVIDAGTILSQASWVGMGWSLDMGSIERNMGKPDSGTEDDTFSLQLNGISSMLLAGVDGYYHTTDESFYRIQGYNINAIDGDISNSYWMVQDKTGNTYYFEYRARYAYYDYNSGSDECRGTHQQVWRWSLTRVVNQFGKTLTYDYASEQKSIQFGCKGVIEYATADLAVYPTTITYPNLCYQVKFERTADRKDYYSNWEQDVVASTFFQKSRLTEVQVKQSPTCNGSYDNIIRKYNLTYASQAGQHIMPNYNWPSWTAADIKRRTLTLLSVQEVGLDTTVLPATNFTYGDGLHLTEVENGYGGRVEFTYDVWADATSNEDMQDTCTVNGYDDEDCGWHAVTGTSTTKWWVGGDISLHFKNGPLERTIKDASLLMVRSRLFKPGGKYLVTGNVSANGRVGMRYSLPGGAVNDLDQQNDDAHTVILPVDVVSPPTELITCLSGDCTIDAYTLTLLPTRYRVVTRNVYDGINAVPQTYTYTYEGAAMNTPANSDLLNPTTCAGECYFDAYTEFRGHSKVTEIGPDGGVTETIYGQNDTTKGKIISQKTKLSSSGPMETYRTYSYVSGSIPVNPSLLPQAGSNRYDELVITWTRTNLSTQRDYRGTAVFAGTRSDYLYDTTLQGGVQYGNVTGQVDYLWNGINTWVAYRASRMRYYPNSTAYLVGLPAYQNLYVCPQGTCDYGTDDILSSVVYYYDSNTSYQTAPSSGKLSYQRTALYWQTPYTAAKYTDTGYLYDLWGNQTTTRAYKTEVILGTVPGQGAFQETVTCYGAAITGESCADDGYHTYPLWTKNVLDASTSHITSYTYDKSKGVPLTETDPNGVVTSAVYDGFGRMLKLIRPGDSTSSPTVQISYNDTAVPFYTQASQKLDASTHFVLRKFYDGLGRPIQTQVVGAEVEGTGGQTIVTDSSYSITDSGQQVSQSVPYVPTSCITAYCQPETNQLQTVTQYDELGRVMWVQEPQDSGSDFAVENSYAIGSSCLAMPGETSPSIPCTITTSTDRNQSATMTFSDALGQVGKVQPAAGPMVTYSYDAVGRMTTAVYGSASTILTYDLAGRKTAMSDPDMGNWTYSYNALGNLTSQTDARGCITSLAYDNLNRLTNKSYSGTGTCSATPAVAYTYDAGSNGKGHRTSMTDGSGSTAWAYDSRGRLITEAKTISNIQYTTHWAYNSADLVTATTYPDGEIVQNSYLPQMALDTVFLQEPDSNYPDYYYVGDTQYDAAGRIVSRTSGADVIDTNYAYYPWNQQGGRLWTLQSNSAQALQNLAYAYDDVGNITSIVDALADGIQTQSFTYDNLNRLHTASAVGGTEGAYAPETYEYDPDTGNLDSKAGVIYTYDPARPHAVTSLSNGNSYTYDANGNQTTRNINALTYDLAYDAENRLVGVSGATTAGYVYDGDGVRVQAVESGATTTYVNSLYEVTENQPLSVPNSGFESSAWTTQGSTGFPATSFYRGSSGIALPKTGTYSQTTSNLANGGIDSASISVSAGATYDVYAYLHGELDANDSNGQWKIQVVYSNGMAQFDPVTVDYGSTIGATWQYEGGQVIVPAGKTSMKVRLINETNSGWIAFDDLEVYLVNGGSRVGSNLISNSGFETTSSWTTLTDFPGTAFYRGSSGIAAPHTGTYAYSISNLAYGTLESPDIPVSARTSYTVNAYLRGELDADDSNGSWTMRVKYYTSSGTYISQKDVTTGTSLTTTWTLKGGTITTPSTAARMRVQFINQMNAGWLAVDDLSVSTVSGLSSTVYEWGFEMENKSEGGWTTSTQSGFSNTTSFYRGGSGIAAPRAGTSSYAISNLANGMLVSESMVTIPSTTYTVNAYLHGEMDSVGSEGNWQINACFYKFDGAPSSCSTLASGSAPAANWTQVSGNVTSPADAATMKLELVGAQLSGWLAWDDVSVSLDAQMITKYYYAGSQRVAVRKNGVLNYLLGDHLGSASVVTDAGGSLLSKMLYKPWGEERYSSGVMPTDRLYTGQIAEPNLGLYFYNARWYDSSLSRFVQADSIIPGAGNPMAWDRYAYSNNNPVKYIDPDGHCSILIGAGIGAIVGGIIYGATTIASGRDFQTGDLLASIAVGAVGGALIGTGVGAGAGITAMASIGAGTGVIGSQVGYSAMSGKEFESSKLIATSAVGGVTGAVTGILGAPTGINPISNKALAFGARMLVDGISGGVDYTLSEVIDGRTPTTKGLKTSVGIGLTAGLAGEILPGYKSQTLDFYGAQVYKQSPVTAYNQFNKSLLPFVKKELLWQGADDALRAAGISIQTNYLNHILK